MLGLGIFNGFGALEALTVEYPKRDSHFAHQYTRIIVKSGGAVDIGLDAMALCVHIAHQEDAKRYTGPVREWNSQICSDLGINENKLRKLREKAVAAGWLHYERGSTRTIGVYWAMIPDLLRDTPENQHDSVDEARELITQQIPPTITHQIEGNAEGNNEGNAVGDSGGNTVGKSGGPSYPNPIPIPVSSCPGKSPDVKSDEKPEKPKSPKYKFAERDMACAKWMWGLILDLQPSRKPPNLESWANCIRLIRECDKRSYEDISALFRWVNADPFWQTNVLSPDKLRSRWDDLQLKRRASLARAGPCGKPRETVDSLYPPLQRPR